MKRTHKLNHIGKRSLSALLALVLAFSLLESGVFAALSSDPEDGEPEESVAEAVEEIQEDTADEEDADPAEEEDTEPAEENFSNEIVALEEYDPADADFADGEETDEYGISTYADGDPVAFAVYSADDNSFTFYTDDSAPSSGDIYKGKTVSNVYTNINGVNGVEWSAQTNASWSGIRGSVKSISFDESFASVQPVLTQFWFYGFTSCTSFDGTNLDTSQVTNMNQMFGHCGENSFTYLDLSMLDISSVTHFANMFNGDTALKAVDLTGWDTKSAYRYNAMFIDCTSLKTIYVSEGQFDLTDAYAEHSDTSKYPTSTDQSNSNNMFSNCGSLLGGAGTGWSSGALTADRAHIDGGEENPGYFTLSETGDDISGSKTWEDDDNRDGKRPESITITLTGSINGGTEVFRTEEKVVTAEDNWAWTFSNLQKYYACSEATYTITEEAVDGYSTAYDGYNVTNSYTPETTEISGSITWVDKDNAYETRPDEVTIRLRDGDEIVDTKTVSAEDDCEYEFIAPKYKDEGETEISYTVTEDSLENYETKYDGYNVTNTLAPGETSVTVAKIWDDGDDADGIRPDSVTVNLIGTVNAGTRDEWTWPADQRELTARNNWSYTFYASIYDEDLAEITYTVEEDPVAGYDTDITGEMTEGFVITNSYTPETTTISGSKTWEDDNDAEGARPESITINLRANGRTVQTKTVSAEDNWAWEFKDVPVNSSGKEITYTITEDAVLNYTTDIDGYDVTNTLTPGAFAVYSADAASLTFYYGLRPAAGDEFDGKTVTNVYTGFDTAVYEGTSNVPWYSNRTNIKSVSFDSTFKEVYPISTAYWFYGLSKIEEIDLSLINTEELTSVHAMFRECSSLKELDFTGWDTSNVTDFGQFLHSCTSLKYVDLSMLDVSKAERIANMFNGCTSLVAVNVGSWDTSAIGGFASTFAGCSKLRTIYAGNGWDLSSASNKANTFNGCTSLIGGNGTPYSSDSVTADMALIDTEGTSGYFTLSDTTTVSGEKIWDDAEDQDGIRPASITITLTGSVYDGTEDGDSWIVETRKITEDDDWSWTFTGLKKYFAGTEITYTITEEEVDGYTPSDSSPDPDSGSEYDITNIHVPETDTISGRIIWADNGNAYETRPENVTIRLYADGVAIDEQSVTAGDEGDWYWEFADLPVYRDRGTEIHYSITEDAVVNYNTDYAADSYDVMNTLARGETSVTVFKYWEDSENQDGKRPENVTVTLLQNGVSTGETLTLNEKDNWEGTFKDLDIYDDSQVKYVYTIAEISVEDYDTQITGSMEKGFAISNSYTPETTTISGSKTWVDSGNVYNTRPDSITVRLHADNEVIDQQTVTAADGWSWEFEGLPVYRDGGTEIHYTITEDAVDNYNISYDDSFNITNTLAPGETSVTVLKSWDDADDQDGIRPESVTVELLQNGKETGKTLTLSEENNWEDTFIDLDIYDSSQVKYEYTVKEVSVGVNGYTSRITGDMAEGFTVTNSYTPETIEISGTVKWDDADDQDGVRPESVTVYLMSGENVIATTTVTAGDEKSGNWAFSFTDIDKYADGGKEVEYTVEEILSLGLKETYTIEITGDMDEGFVITNTHTPETIEISGTITWDDASDQDGKRPKQVAVQLFGQDSDGGTLKTREFVVESNGTDEWTWTLDVSKYRDGGVEVQYTVVYTGVDLDVYEQTTSGLDTTYSYTPETCTIFGSKTWVDDDNGDNTRPESITIELHANGTTVVDTQEITAADGWAWSFEDVPVYSGGHKITYLITENELDDYDTVYTFGEDGSCNVTNSLDPGETSVTVIKDWEDADDQDGKRPESVTVVLMRDGQIAKDHDGNDAVIELTEEGHWIGTFTKIDEYDEEGIKIEYTLQEVDVDVEGYESVISGDMEHGYTVTNTYTPEQIDITGTKIWEDAEDQDGLRPDSVTIHLFANGDEAAYTDVTADDDGNWTFTFTGLDKYSAGSEISYTISEEPVENYESAEISGSAEYGFTVTNTHTPETIEVSGTKVWDDDDDRDGLRPGSITVTLLADGKEIETTSLKAVEGFWGWFNSIVAFFSREQTVKPDEDGNWNFSFEDLPKYRDGGTEIEYTIVEDTVEEYDTSVSGDMAEGFTITNTHEIETVTVAGSKIWDDADDQDGKRPVSVQINLLADKEPVLDEYGNTVTETLNEDHEDDDGNWNFSFEDLPRYHDGGKEYTYSITEEQSEDLAEYETSYDGYNVINSYTPELLNGDGTFRVVLVWDDEADNDGIRPSEVNLTLTKDNTAADGVTLTLTADETDKDGNWTGTFTDLPKCENGAEIAYSVKEDYLSGYTYRIEVLTAEDGSTYVQLTNVHVTVKENIEVTKIWDDEDNQDGKRPDTIMVRLLLNGSLYKTVTIGPEQEGTTVSEDGNQWSYTMQNIPVDKNGETVEYTVIEVDVANYETPDIETIRGDYVTDNGVTYQPYSFVVTNSHTPEQIEISGTKAWDDADDQDGVRPHYVSLHLYADGVKVDDLDVTAADDLNGDGSWEWSFPARDKYADGKAIEYTVEEDAVKEYGTEITGSSADGFTVTNSHTPETTTISGSKTWMDDDNADGKRPDSITIELHANGQMVDTQEVTADDGWAWTFEDVPVYAGGQEITYLISEDEVNDYDTVYTFGEDGSLNVTNILAAGETSVTVIKDWEDAGNQDGKRPESVTVALLRDGKIAQDDNGNDAVITLTAEEHWIGTFLDMHEYDDSGTRIEYTLQEVNTGAEGYTSVITGDTQHGFVVTNSYTPEKISVTGAKTWEDADDQDGKRPDHVTVHLLADGTSVESQAVTAADNWTWTFTGLDKYADGKAIEYTIEEAYTADGYDAEVEGFNITNSHTPSRINITGTKTWDDAENQDGIRPGSVTVGLYANGEPVLDNDDEPLTAVVNEGNGWSYKFEDLDEYAGGEKIGYTVVEETVDGYSADYQDYSIINQHSPEKLNGDGTLGVILRWDDAGNQDGIRPASNTVTLTVNGVEDETRTVVLSDENMDDSGNWIGSFTDLDKYENGVEIKYSVSEGVMSGYTYTAELRFDEDLGIYYIEIINTHAAVTTDITMTKVWDDADNQDGKRPDEITVNLASNGSAVKSRTLTADTVGVTVSNDGNEWTFTFEDLPVDQNGKAIVYSLTEIDVGGYSHEVTTTTGEEVTKDGVTYTPYSFTVTNSHTPEKTAVSVEKIWIDGDDQDGLRPQNLTVCLFAGKDPVRDEGGEPVTGQMVPDDDGNWIYIFEDLDKYAAGTEIDYRVDEVVTDGYEEISLTGNRTDGFTITNRHEPETTDISGNKVWADDDNAAGYRPESITVNLYANGLVEDSQTVTAENGWSWTFEDIPVYSGGQRITYVTTETAIDDYSTTYYGFTLTNTLSPGETSVTVFKDWEDNNDQDGKRPESVQVALMRGDEIAVDHNGDEAVITLTEEDGWEGTFEEIDEFDENGTRIQYTVQEITTGLEYYDSEVTGDMADGFVITNSHTPETTSVTGSKTWDDADDQDGIRPETITIYLYADGQPIRSTTVNEKYEWTWTFEDLPKYRDGGVEIEYTFGEKTVTDYETSVSGPDVTNSHSPELLNGDGTFKVILTWDDEADNDGIRPEAVNIKLTRNNTEAEGYALTLTADETDEEGNWIGTFTGLPKYEDGEEISYSVKEDYLSGYTYRIEVKTDSDGNTYVQLTNVHVSVKEDIEVTKIWDDADNQDGIRPDSITVRLLLNNSLYKTVTLTEKTDGVTVGDNGNTWTYTMKDIPVDKNGETVEYTLIEVDVDNYNPDIETVRGEETEDNGVVYQPYSFTVTNSHTPETTSVSGSVIWDDAGNQDGLRPGSVTLHILADGTEVTTTEVVSDGSDSWAWTYEGLPKYRDGGEEILYTVSLEEAVSGYETEIKDYNIYNSHTPETTTISGSKTWVDDDNVEQTRPDSITIRLHADGAVIDSETVTAAEDWSWTFADLPVYKDGHEITYLITEDELDDYDTEYTFDADGSYNVTNTLDPGETSVTVMKDWEDAENQDGLRPGSVTVALMRDGEIAKDHDGDDAVITLTGENHWIGTFTRIDEYDESGVKIQYTLQEVTAGADGYTSTVTGDTGRGFVVTNAYEPETTQVDVVKTWDDADDQDGLRPGSVEVHLLADGEAVLSRQVTAEEGWTLSFADLDKYSGGKEIQYTIEEVPVAGYETDYDGYNITNTHTPETVDITGSKTWNDQDDQDGLRPESITIRLYANGVEVDQQTVEAEKASLFTRIGAFLTGGTLISAEDDWSWAFTDLPRYADGKEITYTISEDPVEGYTTTINGYDVTNTHTPAAVELSGSKIWDDGDDQDGLRPFSVTVHLLADGVEVRSAAVTAANDWTFHFSGVDQYAGGEEIEYTVQEDVPDGYEADYDGFTITNTHTPATVDISGSKIWDDNDNQDGIRPDSVTVRLLADGEEVQNTAVNAADDWAFSFEGIPQYNSGTEIKYTIQEDVPDGYEASYNGFDITNTHTPATVSVTGSKTWDDAENQDGKRPESITIRLRADGEVVQTLTVTAADGWSWNFADLPAYNNGHQISYSVTEDTMDDYSASYSGNNVLNSYTPNQTSLTVEKVWNDADDQDGIRPKYVEVALLKNGEETGQTIALSPADNWEGTFEELDEYESGNKISYSVAEVNTDGYTTEVTGDQTEGYVITNTHTPATVDVTGSKTWDDGNNQDGKRPDEITIRLHADGIVVDSATVTAADDWAWSFTDLPAYNSGHKIAYSITEDAVEDYSAYYDGYSVTNSYTPGQTSVTVEKTWNDADDQDRMRPDSVTVSLLKNEEETGETLTLSEENNWEGTFTGLDEYTDGTLNEYTVTEDEPNGYTAEVTGSAAEGFEITNTHTTATVNVRGSKTWDDADNQDGKRPESITIRLHADGNVVETLSVTAEDNWAWNFTGLPKYNNGTAISYTITENAVEEYRTAYDGYDVTNTHTPGQTSLTVVKAWDDEDNQDGIRPDSVDVALLKNGTATGQTITLSDENGWEDTFTELDEYTAGTKNTYTVEEAVVDGYTAEITGNATEGYLITNTHTPATVNVTGSKTWDDADNQDGKRPGEITIRLLADGTEIDSMTVTEQDNWSWTFTDLPENAGGTEIAYTITEDAVEDYSTTYDGYNVTNTHTPGQTSLTVVKAWDDGNDQDGIRPDSVKVALMKNGTATGQTITLSEENGWEDTFTGLDEYTAGTKNVYTVDETVPTGYTAGITGDAAEGYRITNTHTPATVNVTGSKTWDDADNQDGKRPDEIMIRLLADGTEIDSMTVTEQDNWSWTFADLPQCADGTAISYTITEDAVEDYSTTYDGYNVTNTHTPGQTSLTIVKAWDDGNDQDGIRPESVEVALLKNGTATGQTITLSDENGWEDTFTELDEYTAGIKNVYTVEETAADGYTAEITGDATEGYLITNTHTPATVSVSGSKTWDDNNDQDGKRPGEITIRLLADGTEIDSMTVTEQDNWSWTFADLPQCADGTAISYTITEDAVEDYSTTYDGYNVTNTHTPGQTSLTVVKAWDDGNDQDGIRPDSVKVALLKNGTATGQTVTLSDENGWEDTFTELDEYTAGTKNVYTVDEISVSGYDTKITGDETAGYRITNTYTPATVSVSGNKTWDDADNQDGKRPDEITIRLLADGTEIDSMTVTEQDNWSWTFTDLPENAGGTEIAYTITEDAVEDYSTTYDGYDVTNTHTPGQTSLTVVKAWDDGNDQDGIRPESVEVALLKNGTATGQTVTLSEKNGWRDSFTGLDEYTGGKQNVYTVQETAVDGYTAGITGNVSDGYTITNTHTPATVSVSGSKTWDDNDDQDGMRPNEITIRLLADGTETNSMTVTEKDNWSWTFADLPQYAGGTEITYTITEDAVDGYSTAYDGYNVTNTRDTETINIPVAKIWEDDDNEYGHRPDSIDIALLADGGETGVTLTLTEDNDWSGDFEDLPKYAAGGEIEYTIREIDDDILQYYTPQISGDAESGFIIVNQREYFDIDEEIVVDENDRDSWVKSEPVNENNAIQVEMSVPLPVIETEELGSGKYTMVFHEMLDSQVVLDDVEADIGVYLNVSGAGDGVSKLSSVNTLADAADREKLNPKYYTLNFDPDDGCSFHVDVDLTALYTDGVITEEDLLGDTEIMIFFYVDLEGTGLNGSYRLTAWYEVYNGDQLQYTSAEDYVEVYTFEISVLKYDTSALTGDDYEGAALAGATMGLYYDAAGEDPVIRNNVPYTATSGEDGLAVFYGLTEGTYYVTELEAPEGYEQSDQVMEAVVSRDMDGYICELRFANDPAAADVPRAPEKTVDAGDGTEVTTGQELTYTISYYNSGSEAADVTITDTLEAGLDFVSATDGGTYDEETRTVTWTIGDAPAYTEGSVELTAAVNGDADRADGVSNTAAVQIGSDAAADTNSVNNPLPSDEGTTGTPDNGNPDDGNPDKGNPDTGNPNTGNPGTGGNGGTGTNGGNTHSPQTDGPEPALTMIALASAAAAAAMAGAVLSIRAYRRYGREYVGKRLKK